jgi:hypothetical protein
MPADESLPFNCPNCEAALDAPQELWGEVIACPSCGDTLKVPRRAMPALGVRTAQPQPPPSTPAVASDAPARGASPLGIASLVIGILACLICWIPFVGMLSLPVAAIGLLLATIGLIISAMNRSTGFGYSIGGMVVNVVAVCGVLIFTGLLSAFAASTVARANAAQRAGANTPSPSTGNHTTGNGTTPASPWHSAATPFAVGDITISIQSAKVGKVPVMDIIQSGESFSNNPQLAITIQITNTSSGKKINYKSWQEDSFLTNGSASLGDSNDNRYRRVDFGYSAKVIGSTKSDSIYPGKSIQDVLIFEPPVDGIEELRLTLPLKNVDGTGSAKISIPATMITR